MAFLFLSFKLGASYLSISFNSSGVDVRLRIVRDGAILEVEWVV